MIDLEALKADLLARVGRLNSSSYTSNDHVYRDQVEQAIEDAFAALEERKAP